MKIIVTHPCVFWDVQTGRVELVPGTQPIEVPDVHALVAVREGWATRTDVETGAPPREKQAARQAPEIKAPEVKAPEVKAPEVKRPEVKAPEVKRPTIKAPARGVKRAHAKHRTPR